MFTIFLKRAAKPSAGNTSAEFPWINLTWLCTKASRNLLRNLPQNPVEPDLALKTSQTFSGTFSGTFCWTWPGSAPKPPNTFSGTSSEPSPESSPEPNQISAPQLSGTSPSTCIGNFRNLTRYLDCFLTVSACGRPSKCHLDIVPFSICELHKWHHLRCETASTSLYLYVCIYRDVGSRNTNHPAST